MFAWSHKKLALFLPLLNRIEDTRTLHSIISHRLFGPLHQLNFMNYRTTSGSRPPEALVDILSPTTSVLMPLILGDSDGLIDYPPRKTILLVSEMFVKSWWPYLITFSMQNHFLAYKSLNAGTQYSTTVSHQHRSLHCNSRYGFTHLLISLDQPCIDLKRQS
ncbi:hypothetical protein J6590_009116 [Homalodisca vitripennis]|nr:hypothetical protein J6590_009116 [Homalodisca vitripennis]